VFDLLGLAAAIMAFIALRRTRSSEVLERRVEALERALGLGSRADSASLEEALIDRGIAIPSECGHGALLDLAMSTVVSPGFRGDALTFVHGYPADQAALARIRNTDPPSAARFEVFLGALELGNGFCELTDAKEQRRRFTRENGMRVAAGLDPVPLDEPFLESLSRGLPDCSGVALGFDRIVAAATHAASIADVVAFTHSRLSP
jgi:lysyl-tRNA synthetase class 2